MAVNLDINLNDKEVIQDIQRILKEAQKLEGGFREVGNKGDKAFNEIDNSADNVRKALRKLSVETNTVETKQSNLSKAYQSFNKKVSDTVNLIKGKLSKAYTGLKQNISQNSTAISDFGNEMLDSVDGINLFGLSIGKVRKAMAGLVKTPVGAFIAAIASIGLAVKAWADYNIRLEKAQKVTADITGKFGELNSVITAQASAIEKVFGVAVEDTLKTARSAVNAFGDDYENTLSTLTVQLAKAGRDQDEFLDSIKEYSVFFADAGFSFEEFANVVNTGIDLGFYSDKLPDAIKEFQISVTEQTQSTRDALENAFGERFTNDLLGNIQSGAISTKDALGLIGEEAEIVGINSQQAAQLTADLFRGAGEDAGGALNIIEALNIAFDENKQKLTELQSLQVETAELYERIGLESERAFGADGLLVLTTQLKNFFLTAWADFLATLPQLRQEFIALGRVIKSGFRLSFSEVLEEVKFEDSITDLNKSFDDLNKSISNGIKKRNEDIQAEAEKLSKQLTEKEKQRQKELRSEYAKTIESLQAQAGAVDKALGLQDIQDPAERAKKAFEFEKEELEKRRVEVVALAQKTGGDVKEVNDVFRILELAAQSNYLNELRALNKEGFEAIAEDQTGILLDRLLSGEVTLTSQAEKVGKELALKLKEGFDGEAPDLVPDFVKDVREKLESAENPFDVLSAKLQFALNLDNEEFAQFEQAVTQTFDSIFQGISSGIDAQIAEQDRLIESLNEREKVIQESIERNLERKEKGYARSVEGKRAELQAIRAEEEQAQKERTELLRKQARLELAINAAQQGANLATAVSQIFASTSGIPFVGIALAAAAVASMFSLFQQFKAQSAQAAITPSLYEGGSVRDALDGYVDKGGQSDKHAQGYRVIDNNGRTRLRLGGSEMVMNEMASRGNEKFLQELNAGKYKGVDITKSLQASMEPVRVAGQSNTVIMERQGEKYITKKEMEELFKMHLSGIIDHDKRKAQTTIEGDKRVVRKQGRERRVL